MIFDDVGFDDEKQCRSTKGFHNLMKRVTTNPDELSEWEKDLGTDNGDAWLALILLLLPNIQRYEAEWEDYPTKWTIRGVSAAATRSLGADFQPMPLQALQEVSIYHGDCHCSIPAREFFPLFLLPSMKSFPEARYMSKT